MKYTNFLRLLLISCASLLLNMAVAQDRKKGDFFGQLSVSANFCQIDGDNASGFNKFGFTAGYIVGQVIKEAPHGSWVYLTGPAFSVRGARRPFNPDIPGDASFHFVYQMIDIPLFITREYNSFSAGLGLRTTYLLSAKDLDNMIPNLKQNMRDVNILACAMLDYQVSGDVKLLLEYQYSANSIRKGDSNSQLLFPTGVYHNVICLGINYQLTGK